MIDYIYSDVIKVNEHELSRAYRYARNITQKDLAEELHVSPMIITNYEVGNVVSDETLRLMRSYLASQLNEKMQDNEFAIQLVCRLIYLNKGDTRRLYELLFDLAHKHIMEQKG